MTLDDDRRARLRVVKARTLVAEHLAVDPAALEAAPFAEGAAVRGPDRLWVLVDHVTGLGAALALSGRESLPLSVMADRSAVGTIDVPGRLARRAGQFADGIEVWQVEDRSLIPAVVAPVADRALPSAAALALIPTLEEAGVDVTVEHGAIRGEIRGLEIARIVDVGDGARIEVGVGRHDREAFTMVHGDLPTSEALRSVVASVEAVRRVEAEAHPLRRLAPEGWLRSMVLDHPALVGAVTLVPAEPPLPRDSVKDTAAAIAAGVDRDGHPVVVACSVGIDLDLVPTAADARVVHDPAARLVLVVPTRDAHPVTRRLAAGLREPATVVTVGDDWRRTVSS